MLKALLLYWRNMLFWPGPPLFGAAYSLGRFVLDYGLRSVRNSGGSGVAAEKEKERRGFIAWVFCP